MWEYPTSTSGTGLSYKHMGSRNRRIRSSKPLSAPRGQGELKTKQTTGPNERGSVLPISWLSPLRLPLPPWSLWEDCKRWTPAEDHCVIITATKHMMETAEKEELCLSSCLQVSWSSTSRRLEQSSSHPGGWELQNGEKERAEIWYRGKMLARDLHLSAWTFSKNSIPWGLSM